MQHWLVAFHEKAMHSFWTAVKDSWVFRKVLYLGHSFSGKCLCTNSKFATAVGSAQDRTCSWLKRLGDTRTRLTVGLLGKSNSFARVMCT